MKTTPFLLLLPLAVLFLLFLAVSCNPPTEPSYEDSITPLPADSPFYIPPETPTVSLEDLISGVEELNRNYMKVDRTGKVWFPDSALELKAEDFTISGEIIPGPNSLTWTTIDGRTVRIYYVTTKNEWVPFMVVEWLP